MYFVSGESLPNMSGRVKLDEPEYGSCPVVISASIVSSSLSVVIV